jgi:hypothetical protein
VAWDFTPKEKGPGLKDASGGAQSSAFSAGGGDGAVRDRNKCVLLGHLHYGSVIHGEDGQVCVYDVLFSG